MKQNKTKIAFLLLCALPISAAAQNLNVHPKVGSSTSISMANVKTFTFGGGNLTITNRDASTSNFALTGMGYVNFSDMVTTVPSLQTKPLITTYPNPVQEVLNIELPLFGEQSAQLKIIGVDGKVVFHTLINTPTTSLSVSALPKGFYICQIQNGTHTSNTKFIKK